MVHISFWQDPFVLELTPEEKYFYLYLLTNSKTSQCGIYELPKKIIEVETGYNRETVDKLLQRFIDYGKIEYSEVTKELFVKNWLKHNSMKSETVQKCIVKELQSVKNQGFTELFVSLAKVYRYPIDSLSQVYGGIKEPEPEPESKPEEEPVPYIAILSFLNETAGTKYRLTEKHKKHIHARYCEGYTFDDFKTVIKKKAAEWLETDQAKYLRPETLFGTKFDGYLNQLTGGNRNGKPVPQTPAKSGDKDNPYEEYNNFSND
jgi:uncharacterized phage protein (TIGR02220 family)